MNKLSVYLVMFLFLLVPVLSLPPAQVTGGSGLQVAFPDFEWGKSNTAFEIPVHVYDMVDGLVQTTGINCSFHIYNSTGNHVFEGNDVTPSHNYDYEVIINDSVFVNEGFYSVQIYCANANLGGFAKHNFYISSDGLPKNLAGTGFLSILILIPLIFGLFMLIGGVSMGEDHTVLRIFLFLLSVPMVWVSFHFGMIGLIRYYGLTVLQDVVGTTTYWMTWLFFVLVSYFIIYAIWKSFEVMAQDKEGRMKY